MLTVQVLDGNGTVLQVIPLDPKEFSTGSRGYRGQGKAAADGKRYQFGINAVEIGSGPKAQAKAKKKAA